MKEKTKKWINAIKKLPIAFIGSLFFIAICVTSLKIISTNTSLSKAPTSLSISFSGKYRIEDGEWQEITKDGHISATKGEVTLRGKFIVLLPNGEFYKDILKDLL